jgi:LEA14-like dessication related protein
MHRGPLAVLALALALVGCSRAEAPKITPEAVKVVKISPAGAELEATLDAWNPNAETLTASSLTTNVSIGGKPDVARARAMKPLELPAKQRLRVTVPIEVEWVNQAALAELAATKQDAQYSVEGAVEMTAKSGKVSAPFRVEGRMTAAELAQATAPAAAPSAAGSAAPAASASASAPPKR